MQGKRYKFNGTSFAVQSALEAGKTISAITQADPGVASATAHGYSDYDVAKLTNIPGMTELEAQSFVLDVLSAGTFALLGIDTSGYAAFVAESPNTAIAQRVTFTDFCELTGFNQQDAASDEIDVTTICSTAKEFELGLSDAGSLTLDYNYAQSVPVQAALRASKTDGSLIAFKIVFPGDGGTLIMFGIVQQQSISGQVGDVIKGTATIKLSGTPYVIEA